MFGKEDHGAKTRRELPDEAGVFGEPFDVALVAAVEKDRALALRAHPVLGVDEVPLLESRGVGEAKVVEVLREISGFVLESLLRRLRIAPRRSRELSEESWGGCE